MASMPKSKSVTIDELTSMVKKGFDEIHGKFGDVNKKLEAESRKNDDRFRIITDEFDRIHSDIRDIKATLGPLARSVLAMEDQISDLRMRVSFLERKAGVEK